MIVTSKKKWSGKINNQIQGFPLYEYSNNVDRFSKLAEMTSQFIDVQNHFNPPTIGLEGYAMGAKGQVFNIGENTGILKYHLQMDQQWPVDVYAPTAIKKFATGKGNANKELMYEAFVEETSVDLGEIFEQSTNPKVNSPVSDIVDAYFIAKLHHTKTHK